MELIYFFGRLHVLLLHLPIGILLLAVILEFVSRREHFRYLQSAVDFMWAAGALSAVGTAVLGYMHASEGGFEGDALDAHRLAGTSLALLACAIWYTRCRAVGFYDKARSAGAVSVVLLLFVTGHFGGNLTHGDTYLAEYAPRPLRRLLGQEDALGFGGAAIDQASGEGGPLQMASSAVAPPPELAPADAAAVNALESNGFVVRPIAKDNPLVQVDYTAQRAITDADLAMLARIGAQIHALNLRDAGLLDKQLQIVGRFANLAHLRLEMNPITDAGLIQLQSLGKLQYLNLYGTKVSDQGIGQLSRLEKLRDLFVWRTSITTSGIAELKRTRADLNVNGGFDPRMFPVGPKVIPVVN